VFRHYRQTRAQHIAINHHHQRLHSTADNHASGMTSVTMICHTLHVINLIVTQYQLEDGGVKGVV